MFKKNHNGWFLLILLPRKCSYKIQLWHFLKHKKKTDIHNMCVMEVLSVLDWLMEDVLFWLKLFFSFWLIWLKSKNRIFFVLVFVHYSLMFLQISILFVLLFKEWMSFALLYILAYHMTFWDLNFSLILVVISCMQ